MRVKKPDIFMLFVVFVFANIFFLSVSNAQDPAQSRPSHEWPGVVLPNYLLPAYQASKRPACLAGDQGENRDEYGIGINCMQIKLMGEPSVPDSLSVSVPLLWPNQFGKVVLEFGVVLDGGLLQPGLAVDRIATTAAADASNSGYQGLGRLSGFNYVSVHQVVDDTDLQLGFGTDSGQASPGNVLFVELSNSW